MEALMKIDVLSRIGAPRRHSSDISGLLPNRTAESTQAAASLRCRSVNAAGTQ
jgi:hypothetical protein